jgi:2',3'-cyclic-nucleotide 2'-phosphodiesterase (5'-nucleotidase family)
VRVFVFTFSFVLWVFTSCTSKIVIQPSNALIVDSAWGDHEPLKQWLQPYSDSLSKEMDQTIGFSQGHFSNMRSKGRITPEAEEKAQLSRIVSDWTFDYAKEWATQNNKPRPDFAVLNHHGLRRNLDSGNITKGQIFEIMPFDNEVVILVLNGTQVMELFHYIAKLGGSPVANLELSITDSQYVHAIIGGNRFDSRRSYCIATIDFMQQGGDGFTMLQDPKSIFKTGTYLRDVILAKVQEETENFGGVYARPVSRILHIPLIIPSAPQKSLPQK